MYGFHTNRVDLNHADVVAALRRVPGVFVKSTAPVGDGFPDLFVTRGGFVYMMEVKSKGGELSDDEVAFASECGVRVYVVYSPEEAVKVVAYNADEVLKALAQAGGRDAR